MEIEPDNTRESIIAGQGFINGILRCLEHLEKKAERYHLQGFNKDAIVFRRASLSLEGPLLAAQQIVGALEMDDDEDQKPEEA